jgi:hypothetical protein
VFDFLVTIELEGQLQGLDQYWSGIWKIRTK